MTIVRRVLIAVLLLLAWRVSAQVYTFSDPVAVTVTTSAVALTSSTKHFVEVCNTDTSKELRVGFSTALTASTGRPVQPGTCIQFKLAGAQKLFGIVASGSLTAIVTQALLTP